MILFFFFFWWGLIFSLSVILKVLLVCGYDDDGGCVGDVFGDGIVCDVSSFGIRVYCGFC